MPDFSELLGVRAGLPTASMLELTLANKRKLLDSSKILEWVDTAITAGTTAEPRIVTQGIEPGTVVKRGTPVDLTMAPPTVIPGIVLKGAHKEMKVKTVAELSEELLDDTEIEEILVKFDSADELKKNAPAAARLKTHLEQKGFRIDESDPETGFEAAFNGAKGLLLFK